MYGTIWYVIFRNPFIFVCCTAGINRSNTAARAVLEQPCSTGVWTDTVRPKGEPTGRTDLSDRSRLVLCNRSQELIGQACPTRRQVLRRTVPVRPPVEHGCSSTARTAVFDWLMPAVLIVLYTLLSRV
ncbi:hypothetical protein PCANC_22062 [Puccinia coronata f. sp. avenae]|uniref:Uncharacterized protein n=1 Tax=Puccinia coronata f. sp. avenae TaxID=200324 RepID=A0A2N5UIS4_9BASI|nr:hypothetical protein PCANC_22062 [Puccinia coronata f. sp. avenae]